MLALLLLFSGCISTREESARAPVGYEESYETAQQLTHQQPHTFLATVKGSSMQPLLSDGTVVVIGRADYAKLAPGSIVAYRNQSGETVIHQLRHRVGGDWITRGINNRHNDAEYVTQANYLGVLYGVFYNDTLQHASLQ